MLDFIIWFILLTMLGWLSFPIAFSILKTLPGRGYALAKALGLLVWGFFFWFLTSLGLLQNDLAGQLVALVILICLSLWAGWHDKFAGLTTWVKAHWRLILAVEGLFLLAFGVWSFVRAANPAIIGTEKPMEMAFITSILRSPTFPPHDPWLSGYAISYYYFGYVMIAMLIRMTGVAPGVGYNLSAALWFALTAIGAYGLLFDLIKMRWLKKTGAEQSATPTWLYFAALLAPFMILIVSNWHGFLDMLHARGIFWSMSIANADESLFSPFWEWIKLRELTNPPGGLLSWLPKRPTGVQWWGASRVLQDFRMNMEAIEVIDEFPFFSYLLADLHPHVLGMPFVLLIISQALNLFLGGLDGQVKVLHRIIPFHLPGLLLAILSLGGLAFMNTWDFPFYLALVAAAFVVQRYHQQGWHAKRLVELILMMVGLGLFSILLYLPFFLSFGSQAGGILPSLIFYTRGVYFWIMFGPLLVPLLIYLIYEWVRYKKYKHIWQPLLLTFGFMGLLFLLTWALSYLASRLPELGGLFLWLQGASEVGIVPLLIEALRRRLVDPLTWLTLGVMMFLTLGLLIKPLEEPFAKKSNTDDGDEEINANSKPAVNPMTIFVLLLVLWGVLLTLAPEFLYLRDQFSVRMNTIFKFYFQTWILWGLAASYAIVVLWRKSGAWGFRYRVMLGLIGVLGLGVFLLNLNQEEDTGILEMLLINRPGIESLGSLLSDWLMLLIGLIFLGLLIRNLIARKWMWSLRLVIVVSFSMGLIYPVVALWNKTNGFKPFGGLTLDGTAYYRMINPDQMAATDWLSQAPLGVMVEAVSPTGGSYTTYASVSAFSGMPTVLGWIGHISQWRGGGEEMGTRQADIQTLYSTASWETAQRIIDMYNIRYIYVGELERSTYALNPGKFEQHLEAVFTSPNAIIFEVSR